jgi:hypothetical protein
MGSEEKMSDADDDIKVPTADLRGLFVVYLDRLRGMAPAMSMKVPVGDPLCQDTGTSKGIFMLQS